MIRKFLNVIAAHIEGLRYPPYAYMTHFFRVNVPLRRERKQHIYHRIHRKSSLLWGIAKPNRAGTIEESFEKIEY
jgi:hypothetical protein